jgi:hypothetical protein
MGKRMSHGRVNRDDTRRDDKEKTHNTDIQPSLLAVMSNFVSNSNLPACILLEE